MQNSGQTYAFITRGYCMNNLNSLIIEGNVVRNAEIREPLNGFKICYFTVAVNRWYKNLKDEFAKEVSYFDIETYGAMTEFCLENAKKGRGIRVVGKLKQSRWEDSNGKKHSRIFVVAEHIEYKPILDAKKDENFQDDYSNNTTESIPVAVDQLAAEEENIAF